MQGKIRYLIIAVLVPSLFLGIAFAANASAAWTSKESARVKALEKRVVDLQLALENMTLSFDRLSLVVNGLNSKGDPLSGYRELNIRFLAITDIQGSCPAGTSSAERYAESFAIQTRPWLSSLSKFDDNKRIRECAVLILSKQ